MLGWTLLLLLFVLLAVALLPVVGKKRHTDRQTPVHDTPPYKFPSGFYWGTAVAAQHVEHQSPNDWTAFEIDAVKKHRTDTGDSVGYAKPGHIHKLDLYPEAVRTKKTDFDSKFSSDIKMLAEAGHNSFRFSIDWARLFPKNSKKPNPKGVEFYHKILKALKKHKLTPFVTLFHFTTPQWFWSEGPGLDGKPAFGWERADAIELWSRFVKVVVEEYGGYIDNYCTINEPMVYIYNGYMQGIFPPFEKRPQPIEVAPVVKRLLEAHAAAYHIIHEYYRPTGTKPLVGITKHTRAFEPLRNYSILDRIGAKVIDHAFIWDFYDAIQTGELKVTNTSYHEVIPRLAQTMDYIGINYYGRFYIEVSPKKIQEPEIHFYDPKDSSEEKSDLNWAVYPRGLYMVLSEAHRRYGKPIFILENGMADHEDVDVRRQRFIVTHLKEMWNAIQYEGVDIRGYMHWSTMDNFEWAEGFEPRFGLWAVDYHDRFKRRPRPSFELYSRIVREGQIDAGIWDRFGRHL